MPAAIAMQIGVRAEKRFLQQIIGIGTGAAIAKKVSQWNLEPPHQFFEAGNAATLGADGQVLVAGNGHRIARRHWSFLSVFLAGALAAGCTPICTPTDPLACFKIAENSLASTRTERLTTLSLRTQRRPSSILAASA